jgi:hypothetical protein
MWRADFSDDDEVEAQHSNIDLAALIRERGAQCALGLAPVSCSRCQTLKTETRITAPAKITKAHHL